VPHKGESAIVVVAVAMSSDFVGRAKIICSADVGEGERQQVVCSRAEQRASPPVLYSASGGYRRTAKAPIMRFLCGLGPLFN
jgi:hypothetical protein